MQTWFIFERLSWVRKSALVLKWKHTFIKTWISRGLYKHVIWVRFGHWKICDAVVQEVTVQETWGTSESHINCLLGELPQKPWPLHFCRVLYMMLAKLVTWAVATFLYTCVCMTLWTVERIMPCFPNHFPETLPLLLHVAHAPSLWLSKHHLLWSIPCFLWSNHRNLLLGVRALEFLGVMAGVLSGTSTLCQATIQGQCVRF